MITVMTNAVRKAARGVTRDFGEVEKLQISKKGAANFVTATDLRTEKILLEELGRARPKFAFLTEESGSIDGIDQTQRFVIDPIDGTTNFIHAIPYISISVAAQKMNAAGEWETTHGVIYDPIHDELFVAERGQGAYLNNQRLRVSDRSEDLVLSTSSPRVSRQSFAKSFARFQKVIESGAVVRCSGSAALDLAYVAAGRLDGTWYNHLNAWDMCAGALIVQEALGRVSDLDGKAVSNVAGGIVAANSVWHAKLLEWLA
jgi:myo-inositol-1(or 4)-monophosphatase